MDARFLVTGAGRCGTHWWQAALDQQLGIATGHEQVYAPWGRVRSPAPRRRPRQPFGDLRGDCSWPAVAYLERAVDPSTVVVHSVRDPLAMVRSRLGDNKLGDEHPKKVVRRFVLGCRPDIGADATDDLGRAILFVTRWNRWCEHQLAYLGFAHRRVRIEDASSDADRFADVIGFLTGRELTTAAAERALGALDDSIGRSEHPPADVSWRDVHAHPNGHELVALATEYGYRVDEP
jgi:hypothetical protein